MQITLKNKVFKLHQTGLWIAKDGEIYVPKSGTHNAHFTYGCTGNRGYKRVMYKGKNYYVHRLVGECFIPNINNYDEVDHIDRDPSNNNVDNLRWASRSMQNYNRRKLTRPKNNAQSKKVLQYTMDGQLVMEWLSTNECGRNGFKQSAVSACCRGEYKQYKGYIWRYADKI